MWVCRKTDADAYYINIISIKNTPRKGGLGVVQLIKGNSHEIV